MTGAQGSPYLTEDQWQFGLTYKFQWSDRHFTGSHEDKEREDEHSQVKNRIQIFDFSLTYALSKRWTMSASLPYQILERSQLNRDFDDRVHTQARGIGDLVIIWRRWMLDPETNPDQNISLGIGPKFPTGEDNAQDAFLTADEDGDPLYVIRNVDQSIQPGDGGFGFVVDISAFKQIGMFTPYFSGSYLFNPEGKSHVKTFRSRSSEAEMSIADQYVVRAGSFVSTPIDNLAFGLGGRVDTIPHHDVLGGSAGFRRPGSAISIEPQLVYSLGRDTFSVSMPWAIYRNRRVSVPDERDADDSRHGDAAFADWVLFLGWTRRF